VAAAWYIPRIVHNNETSFTGSVSSTGVITLDFSTSGQLERLNVHAGQRVRGGQVLATEVGPKSDSLVAADKAAIASDKTKIAQVQGSPTGAARQTSAVQNADLSSAQAQLSRDQAHLSTDSFRAASTVIVAPATGTVVAANGQPGEIVTPSGVRDYAANTQRSTATRKPTFSLLPESPQSGPPPSAGDGAVPVIALQTSKAWQIVALVPEGSVSSISAGQKVTVSVPSANISNAPGKIVQVLPAPIETSDGVQYQAVVRLTKPTGKQPLNGMAASIQLAS
jgi:multidrug resistance efflux pump